MGFTATGIRILAYFGTLLLMINNDVALKIRITIPYIETSMRKLVISAVSFLVQLLFEFRELANLIFDLASTRTVLFIGAIELGSIHIVRVCAHRTSRFIILHLNLLLVHLNVLFFGLV